MTLDEFVLAARELIAQHEGVVFRARPGPRALRRRRECVVVCVDPHSPTLAQDLRDGLSAALSHVTSDAQPGVAVPETGSAASQ